MNGRDRNRPRRAGSSTMLLLILFLSSSGGLAAAPPPGPGSTSRLEDRLPRLATRLLDGSTRSTVLGGRWQLVVLWSVACEACIEALRDLGPAMRLLMHRGLVVSTIALDEQASWPEALPWIRRLALPVGTAFANAPGPEASRLERSLGGDTAQLPILLSIAPSGAIAWSGQGALSSSRLLDALPARPVKGHASIEDPSVAEAWESEETLRRFFAPTDERGDSPPSRPGPLTTLCNRYFEAGDLPRAAVCFETVAATFAGRRDWAVARSGFEQALLAYLAAEDTLNHWFALLGLGVLESLSKPASGDLAWLDRALRVVEVMRLGHARLRPELAHHFTEKLGIPEAWLPRIERYGSSFPVRFADAAEVLTRTARGRILARVGEPERARAELEAAIALSAALDGHFAALPRIELARLALASGRLEDARRWLEEALPERFLRVAWFPDASRRAVFELMQEVAIVADRPEEARLVSVRSAEEARAAGDMDWLSWALVHRSSILSGHFKQHDRAREILEEARRLAPVGDACLQARIAHGLAQQESFTGRLASAERGVVLALRRIEGCSDEVLRSRILRLGSLVCLGLGDHACAEQRLAEASRAAQGSGDGRQRLLAKVFDGFLDGSESGLQEGLESFERLVASTDVPTVQAMAAPVRSLRSTLAGKDELSIADAMPGGDAGTPALPYYASFTKLLAQSLRTFKHGWYARAEALLGLVADQVRSIGNAEQEALFRSARGLALWRLGRRGEAVMVLRGAVDQLEEVARGAHTDDQLAAMFGARRQDIYTTLIEALVMTGDAETAFRYSEMARARALMRQLERADSPVGGAHREVPVDGLDNEITRLRATLATGSASLELPLSVTERTGIEAELGRARAALDAAVSERKLLASGSHATADSSPQTPVWQQLDGSLLDGDTTLVSFFFVSSHLLVWVVDHEGVLVKVLPWTEDDDDHVTCMASRLARSAVRGTALADGCPDVSSASSRLGQKLLAPLLPELRQHVILVPHGVLHGLPFAALRNPETGRYWIEEVRISYFPTASALARQDLQSPRIGKQALVLAASPDRLEPLPAAEDEALAVARTLGSTALTGARATEAAVWSAAETVDVLHLAAHGRFDRADPRSSRIELLSGGGHDGRLEVRELLDDLHFPGLDLVVLSACRTALGDRTRGDDIVGLVRAFMAAGASTVVATLWPVEDRASAELMVAFYQHLAAGQPVAEALRQAQLSLLSREATRDPYFWAAFGSYGGATSRFDS